MASADLKPTESQAQPETGGLEQEVQVVENPEGPSRKRIPDYQLEAVAIYVTEGASAQDISDATGISLNSVRYLIAGKNATFNRFLDAYRSKAMKCVMAHRFRLMDMLEAGYTAIQDALESNDLKLRSDTAWKLFDAVIPTSKDKEDPGIQIILNNPQVQTQLSDTINNVSGSLRSLKEMVAGKDPSRHVLLGDEALPVPEAQLKTKDTEALPAADEAEIHLDLVELYGED